LKKRKDLYRKVRKVDRDRKVRAWDRKTWRAHRREMIKKVGATIGKAS
jgi:hypothetical protein